MEARHQDRSSGYRTQQIMCAPIRLDTSSGALGVLHLVNTRTGTFSPLSLFFFVIECLAFFVRIEDFIS
jgi:hypothetical protein